MSNALHYDVIIVMMSLSNKIFSAPLSSYRTTVVYAVHQFIAVFLIGTN